uniref:Uncharacterized protein n=1 Tax=Rhizophora mucronata TaxID=61149 RepID=A0A2P2Q934_RHIMU
MSKLHPEPGSETSCSSLASSSSPFEPLINREQKEIVDQSLISIFPLVTNRFNWRH